MNISLNLDRDLYNFLFQNFVEAGSIVKTQRIFHNVTNPPLLKGQLDQKILGLLTVPELHLLIGMKITTTQIYVCMYLSGLVDKLMTEMEKQVFLSKKLDKNWMDEFLKKVGKYIVFICVYLNNLDGHSQKVLSGSTLT